MLRKCFRFNRRRSKGAAHEYLVNYRHVSTTAFGILLIIIFFAAELKGAVASLPPVATLSPVGIANRFGSYLAVDGARVLVGTSEGGILFHQADATGTAWVRDQSINTPFGALGSAFGTPVALRGNVALFGASGLHSAAQQGGAAYFYRRESAAIEYGFSQIVWPSDTEIFDAFGAAVNLGDGVAFIGADNDSHFGKTSTGTVTMYRQLSGDSGPFTQVSKFAPADLAPGHDFGDSMDLDGDRLVVGASGNGANLGAAYLYERNAGGVNAWGQVAKLTLGTRFFGEEVAVSGDTVLVSSSVGVVIAGSVSIFDQDPMTSEWALTKQLFAPNPQIGDEFGYAIDIENDLAVVSRRNTFSDGSPGEAFVYGRNQGGADQWGLLAKIDAPSGEGEYFGESVALMGNVVLVGSLYNAVYVYVLPEPAAATMLLLTAVPATLCTRTGRRVRK